MADERRPVRFRQLLAALIEDEIDFIVVGGVAAVLEGAPVSTFDLNIVYSLDEANVVRLAGVLEDLRARYIDPAGRKFRPDAARLRGGGHHLLRTRFGRLDALGSIGSEQGYDDLITVSRTRTLHGMRLRVLSLEAVIATKEVAARPKDEAMLALLRQTLEQRNEQADQEQEG